jgi:hypothetical protein
MEGGTRPGNTALRLPLWVTTGVQPPASALECVERFVVATFVSGLAQLSDHWGFASNPPVFTGTIKLQKLRSCNDFDQSPNPRLKRTPCSSCTWPNRPATKKREELAPLHFLTSSARAPQAVIISITPSSTRTCDQRHRELIRRGDRLEAWRIHPPTSGMGQLRLWSTRFGWLLTPAPDLMLRRSECSPCAVTYHDAGRDNGRRHTRAE